MIYPGHAVAFAQPTLWHRGSVLARNARSSWVRVLQVEFYTETSSSKVGNPTTSLIFFHVMSLISVQDDKCMVSRYDIIWLSK